jgi:uncharacterized SAM-binding protein YcdF (DUF218 family)
MFLLSKLLPLFFLPLGVSLILLLWGLARRRQGFIWMGVAILLVSSNPFVGQSLIRSVEEWATRRSVLETPAVDAIVVLSAGRVVAPGKERVSEWGDVNRFFGGVELYQAGKAALLVFTGAWISEEPDAPLEGDVLAAQARALGVPGDRILVTGRVANTADEAREVARLLHDRQLTAPRILLVTSAYHMPRARQVFEQQELVVEPFPVDFWFSQGSQLTVLHFLPSVDALGQTQTALRELYGRGFYWLRARF